jgi:hypothetical protein
MLPSATDPAPLRCLCIGCNCHSRYTSSTFDHQTALRSRYTAGSSSYRCRLDKASFPWSFSLPTTIVGLFLRHQVERLVAHRCRQNFCVPPVIM